MSELEKVAELKRGVEAAKSEQTRREALADQAEGIAGKALADLAALGCASPDEALAEAARIRAEIEAVVPEIEKTLLEATRG